MKSTTQHLLRSKLPTLRRLHNTIRLMQLPTALPARKARLTNSALPFSHTTSLRRAMRTRPTLLLPIIPTSRVLADIGVARLSRDACCGLTPDAGLAEEDHFFAVGRLREAELVLEFSGREEERVGMRGDGQVDGGGDAVCAELVGFADVD